MPIEIQQTEGTFVPLAGAYNFDCDPPRNGLTLFHFSIDWTLSNPSIEQDILRESLRTEKMICVRNNGHVYRGKIIMDTGVNTSDGAIVVQVL
jgi:hypothetical protein